MILRLTKVSFQSLYLFVSSVVFVSLFVQGLNPRWDDQVANQGNLLTDVLLDPLLLRFLFFMYFPDDWQTESLIICLAILLYFLLQVFSQENLMEMVQEGK